MLPTIEAVLSGLKAPVSHVEEDTENHPLPRLDQSVLNNFNKLSPEDAYDPLEDLSELFGEEIPKQKKALNEALDARDGKKFARIAHTFKGSANNIGARRLAKLCQELEHWEPDLAESQAEIAAIINSIQEEADLVQAALRAIVEKRRC